MLHRGNSDPAIRLRRAKSITSVPRRPGPYLVTKSNDETTRKAALTAATLAFERAAALRELESQPESESIIRSQSARVTRKSIEGHHFARQGSRGKNKSLRPVVRPTKSQHSFGQKANSTYQLTPASRKAASNISTELPRTPGTGTSNPWEDCQIFERFDGYGRFPATKLRKTQSSYAWLQSETNVSLEPPSEIDAHSQTNSRKRLTVSRPSIRENQTDEAIIALARDKYLQEHQAQPLKSRRSYISTSLKSRFNRSKRSSWQSSDIVIQDIPSKDDDAKPHIESPNTSTKKLHKRNSTLAFIKHGWRRAFRRSPSGMFEVPAQHVQSTKAHYQKSFDFPGDTGTETTYGIDTQDWIEDLPPAPPSHKIGVRSLAPSMEEDCSSSKHLLVPRHDRSRVTSWNDSTRQSTIMLRDVDHLPSIQEKTNVVDDLPEVSFPEQNLKIPVRRSSSNFNMKVPLDGRRLISALIKHRKSKSGESNDHDFDELFDLAVGDTGCPQKDSITSEYNQTIRNAPSRASSVNRLPQIQARDFESICFSRDNVISPSVYSERIDPENASFVHRSGSPAGIATVIASQAISKWHVGDQRDAGKHTTSNEWRAWAADKSSGLDNSKEFNLPIFSPQNQEAPTAADYNDHETVPSLPRIPSLQRSISSVLLRNRAVQKHVGPEARKHKLDRQANPMNDRFPMLGTGRTASKSSPMYSRRTSYSSFERACSAENPPVEDPQGLKSISRATRLPKQHVYSDYHHDTDERPNSVSADSIAPQNIKSEIIIPSESSSQLQDTSGRSRDAPLRTRVDQSNERGSPFLWRSANPLDENFLLRIRKGPYGSSSSSLVRVNTNSLESIRLPKRQSPALSARSNENSPPSKGQRMANEFLSSRVSKDLERKDGSSPAFL